LKVRKEEQNLQMLRKKKKKTLIFHRLFFLLSGARACPNVQVFQDDPFTHHGLDALGGRQAGFGSQTWRSMWFWERYPMFWRSGVLYALLSGEICVFLKT
jgi:hypothetical protein